MVLAIVASRDPWMRRQLAVLGDELLQIRDAILIGRVPVAVDYDQANLLERKRDQCIRMLLPPLADLCLIRGGLAKPILPNQWPLVGAGRKHRDIVGGI